MIYPKYSAIGDSLIFYWPWYSMISSICNRRIEPNLDLPAMDVLFWQVFGISDFPLKPITKCTLPYNVKSIMISVMINIGLIVERRINISLTIYLSMIYQLDGSYTINLAAVTTLNLSMYRMRELDLLSGDSSSLFCMLCCRLLCCRLPGWMRSPRYLLAL